MTLRIGYGFNRSPSEFDGLDCDKVNIDMKGEDRGYRRVSFIQLEDNPGSQLVLVAYGDLGAGREISSLKKKVAEFKATIEGPNERGEKKPTKRKTQNKHFRPPEEWEDRIKSRWKAPHLWSMKELYAWLAKDPPDGPGVKQQISRYQLNNRYGPRGG